MAPEHHDREGLHHHQISYLYLRDDVGGAMREPLHDVRARQLRPQNHLCVRVRRGRIDGHRIRECRDRHPAADRRLHHDLLHSSCRQFDANLRVGGFPTNARASGFGWAAGVGRLATAFIVPTILWIQKGWGLTAVFVFLATVLLIAAVSVTQLGPEAKRKGLDELAPPTGERTDDETR